METIGKIRRRRLVQGESISAIARDLGLPRNTVKRALRFEGEAYQFDWSHEHVEHGGVEQVVKVAHVRLCHSRAFFLVAYPRESQEMVFDSHARAGPSRAVRAQDHRAVG